ncbi:sensor histidine kinase [Vallitalea guaymasensis]|uniref:Sensor histidine kinase n=1 Tax=Vallitalea guaymasensis TaxID=1185412 RepID=A0A8J8SEE6_9FIRM|nr:sensor histidine kinase [Vallitalea guaymasensis]QUH31629.1 sensor histidine kinase [Vallitalea guaymasensis]
MARIIWFSFSNLKIRSQIFSFYMLLSLISIITINLLFKSVSEDFLTKKVSSTSKQTLYSIEENIFTVIDNVNEYSKMISSNEQLQKDLSGINDANVLVRKEINKNLINTLQTMPTISSIYIFDNRGKKYAVDDVMVKTLSIENISSAYWYNEVLELKGSSLLVKNAGGIFGDETINYISVIRVINNLDTMEPLGIIIVNIPESKLKASYKKIHSEYKLNILLLDDNNNALVSDEFHNATVIREFAQSAAGMKYYSVIKRDSNKDMLTSYLKLDRYNWKIISIIPFEELEEEMNTFNYLSIIIIIGNCIFILFGSIFISEFIAGPIKKLVKSMKKVRSGIFDKILLDKGNSEVIELGEDFNIMIFEIEELIKKTKADEKSKRKIELNVLYEQIKPHFLYNTIDAIGYMALSDNCIEVYEALEVLGNYYRTSLSKGSNIITFEEELDIVKGYIYMQKIRFGNMFEVYYDLDPEVCDIHTLKLILQPIVENAIVHGIKHKGEQGTIVISARLIDGFVKLIIEDDGVGMSQETINCILNKDKSSEKSSFGLRGTFERLRLYYGSECEFNIVSKRGIGTMVLLKIPYLNGGVA